MREEIKEKVELTEDKVEKYFHNASQSFKERIRTLMERGINIDNLISDWCVTCVHSIRIDGDGICGTGCNGIAPFYVVNNRRLFAQYGKPLGYEVEKGTENVEI